MAHSIVMTEVGKNTTASAADNGFKISLTSFAVTTYANFNPAPEDEVLIGAPLYRGRIETVEAVSGSTVSLRCYVPENLPVSGTADLCEIGIYAEDGTLFAHGKLNPVISKGQEGFYLTVYVSCQRLGDVINVVSGSYTSIPSASRVKNLPPPSTSNQNAVSVLDEKTNLDGTSAADLALKYGPGGNQWAFTGHTRVYFGSVTPIDPLNFSMHISSHGFWLNEGETVIVSVVSGTGKGESRKAVYGNNSFVLESALTIDANSMMAIWRSNSNQLPDRTSSIPNYAVLGIGYNDWAKVVKSLPHGAFTCKNQSGTLAAGARSIQVNDLSDFTQVNKQFFHLWIDNVYQTHDTWTLAQGGIISATPDPTTDRTYQVEVFDFSDLLSASTQVYESYNEATDGQVIYQLPVIPNDINQTWTFLNGVRVPRSNTQLLGSAVQLNGVPVANGDIVVILSFVNYEQENTRSSITMYSYKWYESEPNYPTDTTILGTHNTLLFIDKKYIPQELYDYDALGIIVGPNVKGFADGASLELFVFAEEDGYVVPGTIEESGLDTGPMWVDPAGVDTLPCKVNITHQSYTTDGVNNIYSCPALRDKNYALIFSDGLLITPDQYEYLSTTQNILMKSIITSGRLLDFYFIETLDSPINDGDEILFIESQFVTGQNAGLYQLPTGATLDNSLVMIDGKFEHKPNLVIDANFNLGLVTAPENGLTVYVLTLLTRARAGFTTRVIREEVTQTANVDYQLANKYQKLGTLLFSGLVNQLPDSFTFDTPDTLLIKKPQLGLPLDTISFRNGLPQTRLILRSEFEDFQQWLTDELKKYMPLYGPYVKWSNFTDQVKQLLACPMLKLMNVVNGKIDLQGKGTQDDSDLANKLGLQPVKKSENLDLILTASYTSLGAGAVIGVPNKFNVFKYLELSLRNTLGSDSFSIKTYEKGKKYLIDNINVNGLQFDPIARADLPQIHNSTSVYVTGTANPIMSLTYPQMPLMLTINDMLFSSQYSFLPAGYSKDNTKLRMSKPADMVEDSAAGIRVFTIYVHSDYENKDYTIKYQRPMSVLPSMYNTDWLQLIGNDDNAPGYVLLFARGYANYQYNEQDLRTAVWAIKAYTYASQPVDIAWSAGGSLRTAVIDNPKYLSSASYTAGLTFSATVTNFDATTGDADLTINMSGSVGYTYFPANQLMKSMTLPVEYTIYPGLIVNPDGTTGVVFGIDDLFKSCCWGPMSGAMTFDCTTIN